MKVTNWFAVQFFYRLKKYDFANQGCFSAKLFDEYLNQILPFASTRSKRRLYKTAQAETQEDRVSIDRLAGKISDMLFKNLIKVFLAICAYLFLTKLQENNWVKDTETAKVFGVSNDGDSDEDSDSDDENIEQKKSQQLQE